MLARARLSTLLSASSMTIGIAAVILLLSVAAGAERAFQEALEQMGKNLLAVGAERRQSDALRGGARRYQTLTLADWRAISSQLDLVTRAAPIAMNNFELSYAGKATSTTVIGTTPEFQLTNNQILVAGRFLDEFDILDNSRVAVIGAQVASELFINSRAVGEWLQVAGAPFLVIGVLQEKGVDQTGSTQDDRILVPVTTAQRRLLGTDFVDRIFVQATSKEMLTAALEQIRSLLRDRHGLNEKSQADDFTIRDQAGMLQTLDQTDRSLSRFLAGIASLSLGLASIGLLAVTLLSVKQRQAEIGLRLAVGALPSQLLIQFLSEAVIIAMLGAVMGLLVGILGILVGKWLIGWQLMLTGVNVFYALLLSFGLAIVFAVYPAMRAAQLDPILALRSA